MDLSYTIEEEKFRAELREWLRDNLPGDYDPDLYEWKAPADERFELNLQWHRTMHGDRWVGIHWPKEYGGRGASLIEQLIYLQETSAVRSPPGVNGIAMTIVGPTLMHLGTDEQKQRWLPGMLSADEIWCQGFSEPGAGSDLAALRTSAILKGDHFEVTGQKVWTTFGDRAKWCWLLCRSEPGSQRHAGLTMLCADLTQPGVEVRPLVQVTGDAEFCEVFFDAAEVSKENAVGAVGDGWSVAISTLMFERQGIGLDLRQERFVYGLVELAKQVKRPGGSRAIDDARIRQELAKLVTDFEGIRYASFRSLTRQLRGEAPGPEGSIVKLSASDLGLRVGSLAMEILGSEGPLVAGDETAPEQGKWSRVALAARYMTIAGGTSEIMRNIIAQRVLGLPRGK